MKERITKMSIFRTVMSVLLLAVALGMAAKVAQAAKNRATTFVLEKIQGDVRVVSSSKEEKSILEGMQLINGDHQTTGAESYAWMSLDASKAVKLDENSESALKNVWFSKKLEVYSVKGKLFFNVSVPVAEDEAFNIRTSTMVTGIRGTCGWVEVSDDWKSTVYLLTGKLECLVVNPLDNGSQTITLMPGQYAEFFVFPKSEIEGEEASCGVTTKNFVKEEIPGFVLEELLGNDELIQKIYEETKQEIDLRDLTPTYVQKRIKEDQEKHKKEKQEIEEKAAEELTIVEKEPVWKPENKAASAVAYLLMPQKAETVQKYLNQEKYQKVVLVPGSGSEDDNTLKVDIALTTPAGKTLEAYAGVSVDVLANNSLTVDGTAHLTKLTNEGTVTVRSANTLEIEELLINLGVLEITESGRLVLKKGMETSGSFVNSGVVEAAPDATGEEMIRINGGKVVMLSGMISSNRHDTIMHLADGAKAEFQFAGGSIANEMEDGASILAREEDFQVTVLGTDIQGVTNTILGKGAVLEKYNAASVFRKDERYHLIELDKVDSYPVVVSKVEHGTIIAPSRVEVGAKVTLTAIPDDGYQLESLTVNNYNSKTKRIGSAVSLSAEQSFIMPSSDVIVGGSFVEIAGEPKYQVTVRRANGGSVRVSSAEAKAGEEIQISVQKNAGHELEGITVTDADGAAVGISEKGKGFVFTMPEKNVTVTPAFRTLEYNVVFYDDDERTVLNQQTVLYGSIPEYKGMKPEKSADSQYSYTFAGWKSGEVTYAADARLPEVTGNTVYTAVYATKVVEAPYVAPTTYTVTWRNWDGTELEKDTGLTNGATPSYDGLTPTRDADAEHSYDFAGWISAFGEYGSGEPLPAVTGDITYTARFTFTTRSYTITWLNADGVELEKDLQVLYGTTPVYDGEMPEKEGDAQYSYEFAGWNTAVVPVVGDATYTATYTPVLNSYTIRFLNEDESEIEVLEDVDYGTMPAYTTIPTKTGDAQYSYDFAGWDPELTTVTGDADYTAVFTQRINQYKITWIDEDGTPLQTQNNIDYDTIPSYPGASNPAKAADAQYTYAFAGWKVGTTPYANGTTLPAVRGDVTFTAYYSETLNQYNVTFLDDDGTTPIQDTTAFDYGTAATTYAPADPTKTATAQYTYTFAGWTPDNGTTVYTKAQLPTVTGDVVYKATYTTTIHPTGVSLDAQSLELYVGGTAATLTATISPSNAANKNVIWSSDAESVATVAGNGLTATVTAVSNGTATITAKTEDGGLEATCTVTVKTSVTGVNLDKTELTVILGTTESLQATITPATASNKNLIWTSTNESVATVAEIVAENPAFAGGAVITPVSAGTTTIKVTTEDGSFEKSCAVIVKGYTVTFVNDDDAHTQLNQQLNVAKETIPSFAGTAQPSKTATQQYTYSFAGWKAGQATYPVGTALPAVTGDVTFTAYYDNIINQYNITFVDDDGRTSLKAATAYDYGTLGSAIVAPAASKTSSAEFDYTFTGWIVKGSDGSVKYMTNADLPAVTDNVIYQATYSQTTRTYAIKFHYDGSDNTKIHTQQVPYGTVPVYDGTEPTKEATAQVSYVFAGWQDADGNTGLSSVTGEKEYYATFGESGNTFNITYHLNAGTDASAKVENAVTSYVYGVGATLPTAVSVTRDGYEFSGWYTTATPAANDTAVTTIGTTESGAKEFYAKWTAKKNTLTLNATGGGVFALYGVNADQGSSYDAVTTHPRLSGLSEMSIGSYEYETDQTVYVRIVVARSESVDDTEMTAPNALTVKDASGNTVTATYDAATKFYVFTMPATDCTVEATVVNYQVTIDNTVTGGSVGTNYYICAQENDEVDLIVSASNHYTLNGFTFKNDAGEALEITATLQDTNKYVFTMPACNVTVTPVFVPDSYGITFNMNAGSDASAKLVNYDVTSYTYGAGATLPTSAQVTRDGYEFSGWYTSATPTANDSAITTIGTTESGVKEFYAKWTAKKNTLTLTKAGAGTFSQISVGSTITAGELDVDAGMDDPNESITHDYETDQTVYILASVYKGSVGAEVTEMMAPNSITIQDAAGNVITPTYANGFYSFTMPARACTVTVTTVNYQVYVAEVANGSVTTDHDNCAEAGDTVALNIVDVVNGYEFSGFTFKNDADENVTIATTKVNDNEYTFIMPAYNVTVEPAFTLKTFTVTFFDEDGTTVLKEATTYEFGTPAADIATPDDPTKEDDADYHYTFNGWTPALAEVTANQTYKATYAATAIIHVTGVSLDATEVEAVVGGDSVMVNAIIAPEAAENQNVTWSIPEADAAIASVDHDGLTAWVTGLANGQTTLTVTTEDGNYTASVPVTVTTNVAGVTLTSSSDTAILGKADVILTATLSPVTASNKNVTWTVEDQNVLTLADADAAANESGVAKATIVPRATGSTKITVTTVNGSHTADITITVKGHTVTWVDDDDTVLFEQTNVADSTIPSYPGTAEPSKAQNAQYTYSFAGWKIGTQEYPKTGTTGLPGITGDTTIQAYYTPVIRQYNVTFVDEDGTSELKAATAYNYNTLGSAIVEPEAPAKESTNTKTYTFAGWTVAGSETVYETGHLANVTTDVTYVAKYTEADRLYTVTFYDSEANGSTQLYQTTTTYEGVVEYEGEEPTREEDEDYEYRFNGWKYNNLILISDLSSQPITEDVNFTADYLPISKGLFYYFTNDGEDATPVLHLSGQKEESTWYTLEGGVLDSSKYTNGTNDSIREDITKVVIETEIHPTSMENAFAECYNLVAIENIKNLKTDKVTSMEGAFKNCTSLTSLDVSGFNTSNVTTMKEMFYNCSNYDLKSLDLRGFDTGKVTDMSYMFEGCSGLENLYVNGLVTESVTNLNRMFFYCSGLTSLDVSSFDTKNVTSMVSMFEYCGGLTSLDVSGFDTSKVTDMSFMFNECSGLTSLNVSGWNTGNVTDMHTMFGNMRQITVLDLSSFNTAKVENMGSMFRMETEWSSLQTIFASEDFVTDAVTYSEYMFTNCTNLVGGRGTTYDSSHVDATYACLDAPDTDPAKSRPGYFSDMPSIYYNIDTQGAETVLHFYATDGNGRYQIADGKLNGEYLDQSGSVSENITKVVFEEKISPIDMAWAFADYDDLNSFENFNNLDLKNVMNVSGAFSNLGYAGVLDLSGLNTSNVRDMSYMFANSAGLTSIVFGDGFDTSKVENFASMFEGCTGLTSLDLSAWDMGSAKNLHYMFYRCSGLTSLNLDNVNTVYVTDMSGMFQGCEELTSLSLANFQTGSVTTMESMFEGCKKLVTIDVSGFDTSYVTDFSYMFLDCYKLTTLDVSGFDTAYAEYMYAMFQNCNELTALDVSGFETEYVTTFSNMFFGCGKLTELDLTNFDTSNAEHMSQMFYNCVGLTNLDLSSFDTANVEECYQMFAGDYEMALTTIIASDAFVTTKVTDETGHGMFTNCTNLVGGKGTLYDPDHVDYTYARVDGGTDAAPGYFSVKPEGVFFTLERDVTTNDVVLHLYGHAQTDRTELMDGKLNSSQYVATGGETTLNRSDITKVIIEEPIAPANMASAFYQCTNLKEIQKIENLNTKNVTDMSRAFQGCEHLTEVDLSGFDTSNVTDMSYMFAGMGSEEYIELDQIRAWDLSSFDTSKVTTMEGMFEDCHWTSELKLTSFNTSNVTNMASMFQDVYRLDELDLTSFNTKKVTDMSNMFDSCYVTTIYATDNFDVSIVTEDDSMFEGCSNLIGGRGTRVSYYMESTDNPTDKTYARIDKVDQPGYFTDKNETVLNNIYYTITHVDDENETLSIYGSEGEGRTKLPNGSICWMDYTTEFNIITAVEIVDEIAPNNMAYAFANLNAGSIEGLDKISTVNVTDMRGVFCRTGLAGTLDLTNFDTANVTAMDEMFYGNSELTNIVFGDNFTTANVESMDSMFYGCSSLSSIDLSSFDTAKVTDMSRMFENCSSLAAIDVAALETDRLASAAYMFKGCSSVESLDMSNFDTSRVTSMSSMFSGCSSLTALNLSYFNTSKVENMGSMFKNCSSLTSLDLSSFDTSNVEAMDSMFYNCISLSTLDVSSFNTAKVRKYDDMFAAGNSDNVLTKIYASSDFVVSNPLYSWSDKHLFTNRQGLVGGNGTAYDDGHVDGDYARIDGAGGMPGYFTEKSRIGIVSLSGEVGIGKTLTVTVTDTDPSVGTLTYAWKRIDKDDNEEYITGATGNTYTATEADVAHLLACEVSDASTTVTVVTETRVLGDDKTVSFNMNGVQGAAADYTPDDQTVAVGGTVAIPGEFPEFIAGNAFAGWYTEAACTTEWDFEKDIVEDDMTLFAKWNAPIYWRVDDSDGYPTLYLQNDDSDGATMLLTQKFDNAAPAPWSDTGYQYVEIVDDIYPTYLSYWFYDTSSELAYISGMDKLHTEDVVDMSGLFSGATNLDLSTLDLSNFNTAKVRNMSYMFQSAGTGTGSWLDSWFVDLTSFDTSNVENMSNMFESAENLRAIYVSDSFVTTKVTNGYYMFSNCYYLTGGNGTTFTSGEINSNYAWIDGKDGKPGYLSRKPETAHAIHILYLDEYGGSMSDAVWTENTDRATSIIQVNGSETASDEAYQYDRVDVHVYAEDGYKITDTPYGSDDRRDSITSADADYNVGGIMYDGSEGFLSLRMPDHDIWVYAKAEALEDETAGSITTYYKVWDNGAESFSATPAGGTVTVGEFAGALAKNDVINLTITPKEGYQLSRLRAVYWYVGAGVSYEFGSYGGEDITEITYDATGVGTATYEISEVMDTNRLILEVTFMEDMEYDVQFMQGVKKDRDIIQQDGCGTLTTMVGDNIVTKVRVGEQPELTITPETDYRLQDVQAFYTNDVSNVSIPLNQHKTKDNTYLFDVESTYFNGGNPKHILVAATFIHGYTVTKNASSVGGSFSLTPASSESLQEVVSGDTVTISVTPETGLTVDQILVEDGGGNLTEVTEVVSGLSYQFVMPEEDVTVRVTFKAETAGTVTTLTEYQSAAKIQQYLNMSGVSEVKLSPSDVNQEYVIDGSLTIPEGKKLTVDAGTMLKVSGNITVMAGGTLQNDGELMNMGTIEANTTEPVTRLINYGTLFSAGSITFSSPAVVENHGEYVAMAEPSGFDNQSTASTLISASNEYVGTCGEWAGYGVWDNGTGKELKFYGTGDMNNYTMNTAPWSGVRNSVTTITIPQGITSIGNYAFVGFTAITEIVIPEGVTSIGQHAFDGCSSLTNVTLPTSLTFLGGYAFNDCAVTSLTYPGGPAGAGIYLPPNLEAVAGYSFYNCPLAATVVVPSKVYQIAPAAFGAASESSTLQEIWLPASLTDIYAAFGNRSGLTTIHYAGSEADWAENYVADGAIPAGATIVYNSSFDD